MFLMEFEIFGGIYSLWNEIVTVLNSHNNQNIITIIITNPFQWRKKNVLTMQFAMNSIENTVALTTKAVKKNIRIEFAVAATKRKTAHNNHYNLTCSASCRICWNDRFVHSHCSHTHSVPVVATAATRRNFLNTSVELIAILLYAFPKLMFHSTFSSQTMWLHFNNGIAIYESNFLLLTPFKFFEWL